MKTKVLAEGPALIESKGRAKIKQFGIEKPIEGL